MSNLLAECLCAAVSVSVLVHQPITDMSKERLSVFINIDPIISASRGWPSGSQTPRAVIKLQSHSIYLQSREATEQRSHCTAHFAERAGDLHLSGESEKYEGALQRPRHWGAEPHTGQEVCLDVLGVSRFPHFVALCTSSVHRYDCYSTWCNPETHSEGCSPLCLFTSDCICRV